MLNQFIVALNSRYWFQFLTIFILLFTFHSYKIYAQGILHGKVVDSQSGEGIIFATVTSSARNGVITDSLGNFRITIEKYPVVLNISHVSYPNSVFTLQKKEQGQMVFRIAPDIIGLKEVVISGKKLRNLTARDDFSVIQFEFDCFYLWMIGLRNNSLKGTRLYLANLTGDTIKSVPVNPNAVLKKDFFGIVHLQFADSIFQLTAYNNEINLLYGESVKKYNQVVRNYKAVLGKGLAFYQFDKETEIGKLFYIDSTMVRNEAVLTFPKEPENLSWLPSGLKRMGEYVGQKTLDLIISQQREYMSEMIQSLLFNIGDSCCIVDLYNDKLRIVGPEKNLVRSVPISFNHQPEPTLTNLFLNFHSILTDQMLNHAYVAYHINNNWEIKPLNLVTGVTGPSLDIPQYNAMTNIRVHYGSFYFIYPEKIYPYYYRVYKQVIQK